MIDIDEIRKRAQQASQQTVSSVKETMEKNEERISKMEAPCAEKSQRAAPSGNPWPNIQRRYYGANGRQ